MNRRAFLRTVAAVPVASAAAEAVVPRLTSGGFVKMVGGPTVVPAAECVIDNATMASVYDKIDALCQLEKQVVRGVSSGLKFGNG